MPFVFTETIYKVGINPCVPVPRRITDQLKVEKGFIYVKGTINGFPFVQTLMPVKNEPYRLYVNGPMLKGANLENGDKARFAIEQNHHPEERTPAMLPAFRKALAKEKLMATFKGLTPSRQKEILRYMRFLKSPESIERNIVKVVGQLKEKAGK